jgi:Tfp pilus assembly ATPase PilU
VAYPLPGVARFRTNIFHSKEKFAIVMRRIITKIPNFDELNLPPQVEDLANHHRGIIIVSGTTGSGKSRAGGLGPRGSSAAETIPERRRMKRKAVSRMMDGL